MVAYSASGFVTQVDTEWLISKRDAGGTNYETTTSAAAMAFYDGVNTRTIVAAIPGRHCLALNAESGLRVEAFFDGLSVGLFNDISTLTVNDAPLKIGNYHNGNFPRQSALSAVLIVNRRLTATEHALLYSELQALTWPTKRKVFAVGEYGPELITDGDMRAVGVAAWDAVNDALVTKVVDSALADPQVLQVEYVAGPANNPEAYQNIGLVNAGLLEGWARGDGTAVPEVWAGGDKWTGTNSVEWQHYSIAAVDEMVSIRLQCIIGAAGFCRFSRISFREMTVTRTQFKTDWGAKVSGNHGGNEKMPGTNYWVNSGNFGITTETDDDEVCKVVTCAASGGYEVYGSEILGDPTQDAYGTLIFWFSKAAGSTYILHFVSDDLAGTNGYSFQVSATEVVSLVHNGVGNLFTSAAGYVLAGTRTKVRITRNQIDGEFHVYIDDVLVVTATGDNPVDENTVTTSDVMVWDVDTGDQTWHSSINGNKALSKQHGVMAP